MPTPASLTRRGFLASASAFAATALAACGGGGAAPWSAGGADVPLALETDPDRRLARVERRHFEPLVGSSFRMAADGSGPVDVTQVVLTELVDLRATNPEAKAMGFREPFALALRGPAELLGREGTCVLDHPEIGPVSVFVCFGGTVDEADGEGRRTVRHAYRICFS